MYRCSIYCQIVSFRTQTLETRLSVEELPTDQPQHTGEVSQSILTKELTTYNIILRENFIYSSVSLFRATTFCLAPPTPIKINKIPVQTFFL